MVTVGARSPEPEPRSRPPPLGADPSGDIHESVGTAACSLPLDKHGGEVDSPIGEYVILGQSSALTMR